METGRVLNAAEAFKNFKETHIWWNSIRWILLRKHL
jgi:hypothetical protein